MRRTHDPSARALRVRQAWQGAPFSAPLPAGGAPAPHPRSRRTKPSSAACCRAQAAVMSPDRPAHTCGARKGAGRAPAIGCRGGGRAGVERERRKGGGGFSPGPRTGLVGAGGRAGPARAPRGAAIGLAAGRGGVARAGQGAWPGAEPLQVRRERCAARVPQGGLTSALVAPETPRTPSRPLLGGWTAAARRPRRRRRVRPGWGLKGRAAKQPWRGRAASATPLPLGSLG